MINKPYKLFFLGISSAIAASASYALMTPENSAIQTESTIIKLPSIQPQETIASPSIPSKAITEVIPEFKTLSHKVKSGDTLSNIFSQLDLSKKDLHNIVHANQLGEQFASIRPGKTLNFKIDSENLVQEVSYQKDQINTLKASRNKDSYKVEILSKPIEKRIASAQATINSSLFLDGKDAGLSDGIIMELAAIFAWDIDFALSVRKGDSFTVVYEEKLVDGKKIGNGNIISAEFIHHNEAYRAVRFEDKNGDAQYFTPDGKSMRKAFLRSPIDFARISSHYNLKRKHPVLNRIRAHKGVDYAARTGTKIKTTGDGKITFRGRQRGYGRVVIVKHGQKYSTLYAHMSKYRKGQRVGSRVKQGDIIGYVGQSGLASGPHLHYEFHVNGRHKNPLTVKLPHSLPIKKSLMAEFKQQTEPLLALLNKAKASTLLAQNQH